METFSALLAIVRGIHMSPVNSPHKGQWRGAMMFSLTCAWINDWVNNREAGDLRRHRAHYDVTVMVQNLPCVYLSRCCMFSCYIGTQDIKCFIYYIIRQSGHIWCKVMLAPKIMRHHVLTSARQHTDEPNTCRCSQIHCNKRPSRPWTPWYFSWRIVITIRDTILSFSRESIAPDWFVLGQVFKCGPHNNLKCVC